MKRLAIMQPYTFPYLGYFQLITHADCFVFLDTVSYGNHKWIHRNQILSQGKATRFTLPLAGASQRALIHNLYFHNSPRHFKKLLNSLYHAYKNAPEFTNVYPFLEKLLHEASDHVTTFAKQSCEAILHFLQCPKALMLASAIDSNDQKGQEKIIEICKKLKGDTYLNPPGGSHLYEADVFLKAGIHLQILSPHLAPYSQFKHPFVSHLSIIDALMFNNKKTLRTYIHQGNCVDKEIFHHA